MDDNSQELTDIDLEIWALYLHLHTCDLYSDDLDAQDTKRHKAKDSNGARRGPLLTKAREALETWREWRWN